MKNLEFLYAINGIDDEFITEAADDEKLKEAFCSEWAEEDESEQTESDTAAEEGKPKNKAVKNICRKSAKRLLLVAVISALVLATGIAVCGKKIGSLDILKDFGDRIVEMIAGESVEYEEIDILKEDESIRYDSIEKFFKQTGYDVLCPSKLPKEMKVEAVILTGSYDSSMKYTWEYKDILYQTSNTEKTGIKVYTNPDPIVSLLNTRTEKIGGYECFLRNKPDGLYCYFTYENNTYAIRALTYEDVVTIVSGMKKYDE